jgi:hypothetical protein
MSSRKFRGARATSSSEMSFAMPGGVRLTEASFSALSVSLAITLGSVGKSSECEKDRKTANRHKNWPRETAFVTRQIDEPNNDVGGDYLNEAIGNFHKFPFYFLSNTAKSKIILSRLRKIISVIFTRIDFKTYS